MTILQLVNHLYDKGCILTGCSDREIEKLEKRLDIRLPAVYRQFLQEMGKDAGAFLRGSDAFYKNLGHLTEYATELMEENEGGPLSPSAFVFFMHRGLNDRTLSYQNRTIYKKI